MSRLIVLTAMTVDGVMTVEEWFVPEGDHMEARCGCSRATQRFCTGAELRGARRLLDGGGRRVG